MIDKSRSSFRGERPATGFFLFLLVVLSLVLATSPRYNGDLVGCVAAALSLDEVDPVQVHRMTYETIKSHVPPVIYDQLIAGSPHRCAMATTPTMLQDVVGIYQSPTQDGNGSS